MRSFACGQCVLIAVSAWLVTSCDAGGHRPSRSECLIGARLPGGSFDDEALAAIGGRLAGATSRYRDLNLAAVAINDREIYLQFSDRCEMKAEFQKKILDDVIGRGDTALVYVVLPLPVIPSGKNLDFRGDAWRD